MYTLFVILQILGIIVLFGEAIYLVNQRPSRQQIRMLLLMVALLVNFVGYLFEMQADTPEQALQAVKFSYLGKPIIVLTMFLFVLDYCKVRMPKWLPSVLSCFHIMITLLVMNCEKHKLFYSSIEFTTEGVFRHLVFGYGPVYVIYHVALIVYVIIMVIACVHKYIHAVSEGEQNRLRAFFSIIAVMIVGWAGYFWLV